MCGNCVRYRREVAGGGGLCQTISLTARLNLMDRFDHSALMSIGYGPGQRQHIRLAGSQVASSPIRTAAAGKVAYPPPRPADILNARLE